MTVTYNLILYRLSKVRCIAATEDRSILSAAKDSPGSMDFSDVQIAHKLSG